MSKMKILLVEDEPGISKLFEYNFVKAGFECIIAENGKLGLEMARKLKPDLIVSDIMMPVADGYYLRKEILKDPVLKEIPFIFLTAKAEEEDVLKGYELEIEEYIVKTSSPKIVMAKISSILKSKEKQRKHVVDEVHTAADKMGAKVVPDIIPEFEGFEIKHWHHPYKDIPGGDFIDYIKIDEDRMIVILGDVMGKRWGAWYFAVAYAGYVRSAVRFALKNSKVILPSKIIERVNESVYEDERIAEVFITLSVVLIDRKKMELYYSGAGDLPLILKRKDVKEITSQGLLLGFNDNTDYSDEKIKLEKGDIALITTDGIIESRNDKGQDYSMERLKDLLLKIDSEQDVVEELKNNFWQFTNNTSGDDLSVIAIKVL